MHHMIRRAAVVAGATTATLAMTAGSAFAHFCYIPNQSQQGAMASGKSEEGVWFYLDIAQEFSGGDQAVAACISDALAEAGLPEGVRIMNKVPAPHLPALGSKNPNFADKADDGKGIDHLSEDMIMQVEGIVATCFATSAG